MNSMINRSSHETPDAFMGRIFDKLPHQFVDLLIKCLIYWLIDACRSHRDRRRPAARLAGGRRARGGHPGRWQGDGWAVGRAGGAATQNFILVDLVDAYATHGRCVSESCIDSGLRE